MFKKRVLTITFLLVMLCSMALIANAADHSINSSDDLQATINIAAAGDTIILANGNYDLPAQITIGKNITIKGASVTGVVIRPDAPFTSGDSLFKISNAASVTIENLKFANSASGNSNYAIEIATAAVTLKTIRIEDFKAGGVTISNSTVNINDLSTSRNGSRGIFVSAATSNTVLTISDFTASENKVIEVASPAVSLTTVNIPSLDPDIGPIKTKDTSGNMVWYRSDSDEAKATMSYIVASGTARSTAIHYTSLSAAAADSRTGDTIYIKPGEHSINSEINFTTKNVNLTGISDSAGNAPTLKAAFPFTGNNLITLNGINAEVKITNLNLAGNNISTYGINIVNCQNAVLKDVKVSSFRSGGVNANSSTVTFDGLKTENNILHGINFANSATPTYAPSLKEAGKGYLAGETIAIKIDSSAKTVFDANRNIIEVADVFWAFSPNNEYIGIQNPALTRISGVKVTKTDDTTGTIEITFSSDMSATQPAAARIFLDGGYSELLNGAWNQTDKKVYTVEYKELDLGKTYILNVTGFIDYRDLAIETYRADLLTTPESPSQNATLDKTSITSVKENNVHKDQTVTLTLNGRTLSGITNGTYTLVKDTDYTVSGNDITIKASYLNTLADGDYIFTFSMNAGTNPTLAVKLTPTPPPWVNPFSDVAANDWFYPHVEYAVVNGLFTGVTTTLFAPDGTLTRGMMVTLLGRLAGINPSSYAGASFGDVSTGEYYAPYVKWASENDIVNGVGNNKFAPAENISRQDLATIMHRYAQVMEISLPVNEAKINFNDRAFISNYATSAVEAMQRAGIINGKLGNLFDPLSTTTRAETATLLHRFSELTD